MAFYPWLTPERLHSTDIGSLEDLFNSMQAIKAQGMLDQLAIESYPNMKRQAAENLRKQLHTKAFPWVHAPEKKAPITPQQLQQALAGKGTK